MSNKSNGSGISPEAQSLQISRMAQQAATPLRKLTAMELLGRGPVEIHVPEFPDAVFYFRQPSAPQVIAFFESKDRIFREVEKQRKRIDELRVNDGVTDSGEKLEKAESSTSPGDLLTAEDIANISSGLIEEMRLSTCKLLAVMLVNETGEPVCSFDEIANEMSRENYLILAREMTTFLGAKMGVRKIDDQVKTDEDVQSDLILLEDEIDKKDSKPVEEEGDSNPNS
jgi:hypothetical protein